MTVLSEIVAPQVRIFAGKSDAYFQFGSEWRRASPEDEAHAYTGFDRTTREPSVGIYVTRRPNGLMRIGFDLWRLDFNLRGDVVERLEKRWREDAAALSKSLFRSVARRAHFSKSFAMFEISPESLESWKRELTAILENPESFISVRGESQ